MIAHATQIDEEAPPVPRELLWEAYRSFAVFLDFTFSWLFPEENIRLDPDDATMHYVDAIQNYPEWGTLDILYPRGTGKTTISIIADLWIRWHHPWLKAMFLTATPDVKNDIFLESYKIASEHPMLGKLRPLTNVDVSLTQYDTRGHRGKGRSFRTRTATQRKTGGRCNTLWIDDLEVPETVANPFQRMKMRSVLSESENLHFKKDPYKKTIKQGTPWDADTIYRDMHADRHIEIPAVIQLEDGSLHYPFKTLDEEELAGIRRGMKNDEMFRAQYLLDVSRDEEAMPIRMNDVRFLEFQHRDLLERVIIIDPAGGTETAAKIKAMREGQKDVRGDGMTIGVFGLNASRIRTLDMWSECTRTNLFLQQVIHFVKTYEIRMILVEQNYGGWAVTVRMALERVGLHRACAVEPFHTASRHNNKKLNLPWQFSRTPGKGKLSKVLKNLVPAFQQGQIEFHERLAHYTKMWEQIKNLRWHTLPTLCDILDVMAMACEHYEEYLHLAKEDRYVPPPAEPNPDGTIPPPPPHSIPMPMLEAVGAPAAVRRVWGRTSDAAIIPARRPYG